VISKKKKKKLKRTNIYRKNSRYCNHLNNSPKHNLVYKEMIQELQVSFGTLCTHKNIHYKPKKYIASTQKKEKKKKEFSPHGPWECGVNES
jgi:hypothetical protein